MTKKKVSIIVPCYNAEKYLEKCLNSLINQTLKDIEVIAINDGSSDNTLEILKKYQKKYPKIIKYYSFSNQGVSKTRNFGLKVASGEYIGFVDSDDYVDINTYEIAYNTIKQEDADVVVWNYLKVFEDVKKIEKYYLESFKEASIKEDSSLLLKINAGPCNKLYKKELFDSEEFEVIKYEDLLLITKILCKAKKIYKIDDYLYYYVIHSNSETTILDRRVFDVLKIVKDLNRYFIENKIFENSKELLEYYNINILLNYSFQQRNQQDKEVAKIFIDKAYKYLDSEFPNWRCNELFNRNNKFLKKIVKKNKSLCDLYVNLYRIIRRKK